MHIVSIGNVTYRPATSSELSSVSGIIYAIRNRYDGKTYVGKTSKTFNYRYGRYGRWWISTSNLLLKRVLNHNAHTEFDVFILRSGITDQALLNEAEKECAVIFNSYAPNGYNLRECGEEGIFYGDEVKSKIADARAKSRKIYRVRHIATDNIITICHVKKWCSENGIREMAFRNLLCGIVETSQGYCREDTSLEDLAKFRETFGRTYTVRHISSNELITFSNAVLFCEERGIGYGGFKSMLCGKTKTSNGYSLPDTVIPERFRYQITSPSGEIIEFTCVRQFERSYGIRLRGLLRKGIKNTRHGWSNLIAFRVETQAPAR